jgi:hypothetical protein
MVFKSLGFAGASSLWDGAVTVSCGGKPVKFRHVSASLLFIRFFRMCCSQTFTQADHEDPQIRQF